MLHSGPGGNSRRRPITLRTPRGFWNEGSLRNVADACKAHAPTPATHRVDPEGRAAIEGAAITAAIVTAWTAGTWLLIHMGPAVTTLAARVLG